MRRALLAKLNSTPGTEITIDSFRLRFPLRVEVDGVKVVQQGDTTVRARRLEADVALLPLITGKAAVRNALLADARYQMGNPDSAMMIVIQADTVHITPASIKFSPLKINVDGGRIAHGSVSLRSNPFAPKSEEKTDTTGSPLYINVGQILLEDFTYSMDMLPTIDSLGVHVAYGRLQGGAIDLLAQTVDIKSFTGHGLNAAYIAPDSAQIASVPEEAVDTAATKPWTVQVLKLKFTESQGLYTTHGLEPLPGLDFGYIKAHDMTIEVDSFYNQATTLRLPITMQATERCGVTLQATGTFAMTDERMDFQDFRVLTDYTELQANGYLGVGDMLTDPNLPLALDASGFLGVPDMRLMFPAFKPFLTALPDATPVRLDVDVKGTAGNIDINELALNINRCLKLSASGTLENAFLPTGPDGDLILSGRIINVAAITRDFLRGTGISVPPMLLDGRVIMRQGLTRGKLQAQTLGGTLKLDASLNQNSEGYALDLTTDKFPVQAFLTDLGVGTLTADLTVRGQGFDFLSPKTKVDANAQIASVEYQGYPYKDIDLEAHLADGVANVDASVDGDDLSLDLSAHGTVSEADFDWTVSIDADNANLYALHFIDQPAMLSVNTTAKAKVNPKTGAINAALDLHNLNFAINAADYVFSDVRANFDTSDSLTMLKVVNRDLLLDASTPCGLDTLMAKFDDFAALYDYEYGRRKLRPDSLQMVLPKFRVYASSGADNMLNDILSQSDMRLERMDLRMVNDTTLRMKLSVNGLTSKTLAMDSIQVRLAQRGEVVLFSTNIDNLPGTMDDFAHISLQGMLDTQKVTLRAKQRNIDDVVGYDLGLWAQFADSTVTVRLRPLTPVIGYKDWTVNEDNYIKYNFPHQHIDANLRMQGDKSRIALYTEHNAAADSIPSAPDDIVLQLADIQIQDWIKINPWAPPMSGNLSADIRLQWDGASAINGNGSLGLDKFYYNKQLVGDFKSDLNVSTNASGMIRADVDLLVNGAKALTISGALNDSTATSPFNLDFGVIHFPLAVANPFMPDNMVTLSGTLSGTMDINGDAENPIVNGNIRFDDAAIKLKMTNTAYKISDVDIPVVDNVVTFSGFGVKGTNENPLLVNGTVDMSTLTKPRIDLDLKAKNMMIVNSNRALHGADIFGRGYIDLNAKVQGNMKFMSVRADLSVLSGTNITYVLTTSAAALQSPEETGMVKFVNFADTMAVQLADSIDDSQMLLAVDATLNLMNGNTINVDLGTARDKVEVQATGSVNYVLLPMSTDGRLTGRVNINDGFARYAVPVVGEKIFNFQEGSYIAFTGDMMNPTLNLHADDQVKTNVTLEGQNSRIVNFDILLGVTGTLAQMDVKFDLKTNDDITIANQLQGMTDEQRANQAMNLLLYNMYTGPGSSTSTSLSFNPLYSFLESQINNWAANNIKGVDLSFGIDQYNQTTNGMTSSTMTYSYQVSKSLFNDRFKIVVGGNYNTDDGTDQNLEQNLVNDVSIEYYLNSRQTMLVKIFRHTGYESILEGEITQTGVGFVYKRKLNRLVQIFPRFMRPKKYRIIR